MVGALILSLFLPEAPVVSGHLTEMAGDPSTGVFGLGRDFSLAYFHRPPGPCLHEHGCSSSVSHPVAGLPRCRMSELEGTLVGPSHSTHQGPEG